MESTQTHNDQTKSDKTNSNEHKALEFVNGVDTLTKSALLLLNLCDPTDEQFPLYNVTIRSLEAIIAIVKSCSVLKESQILVRQMIEERNFDSAPTLSPPSQENRSFKILDLQSSVGDLCVSVVKSLKSQKPNELPPHTFFERLKGSSDPDWYSSFADHCFLQVSFSVCSQS